MSQNGQNRRQEEKNDKKMKNTHSSLPKQFAVGKDI